MSDTPSTGYETPRAAAPRQIQDLAGTIANQADAIAMGRTTADIHAVARLLLDNAETLVSWTAPKERP